MPGILSWLIICKKGPIDETWVFQRFGSFFDQINYKKGKWAQAYYLTFMMRRLALIFAIFAV